MEEHNFVEKTQVESPKNKHHSALTWVLSLVTLASVSAVAVMIFLLINSQNQSSVVTNTTSDVVTVTEDCGECLDGADNALPDGFAWYTNEELGIKFAYPTDWGEVSVSVDSMGGVSGSYLHGVFSLNEDVYFGGNGSNYVVGARGGMVTDNPGYLQSGDDFYTVQLWTLDGDYPSAPKQLNPIDEGSELVDTCSGQALVSQVPYTEFYGMSYDVARVNLTPSGDYYGLNFVAVNPDAALRAQFDLMIASFQVL